MRRLTMTKPARLTPPAATRPTPSGGSPAPAARAQRGIQSVEVGGQLLRALAEHGRPLPLKDLAQAAGMGAAKAHPYLVSYGKLGLVVQDTSSGHYGLGPLARQLGLISLQQSDPLRLAGNRLPALARQIGHTVALAVWGTLGPTIVRVEQGPAAIVVNMRLGSVVSVRGTASGRLFAAHGRADLQRKAGLTPEDAAAIRASGVAAVVDGTVPGISAAAAAVFDASGDLVLGLTAIGPGAVFDSRPQGTLLQCLADAARSLSDDLGAPPRSGGAQLPPG
jgi:DNA-binding IclR family transcriptional regulator